MIELILLIGLFYPKIALLVGYLTNSILPNPFPFVIDLLMAFFLPRLLFIFYIAINIETLPYAEVWLIVHAVFLLVYGIKDRVLKRLG